MGALFLTSMVPCFLAFNAMVKARDSLKTRLRLSQWYLYCALIYGMAGYFGLSIYYFT